MGRGIWHIPRPNRKKERKKHELSHESPTSHICYTTPVFIFQPRSGKSTQARLSCHHFCHHFAFEYSLKRFKIFRFAIKKGAKILAQKNPQSPESTGITGNFKPPSGEEGLVDDTRLEPLSFLGIPMLIGYLTPLSPPPKMSLKASNCLCLCFFRSDV